VSSSFYIVPSRKYPSSLTSGSNAVTSLNSLTGDIFIAVDGSTGITSSIIGNEILIKISPEFYVLRSGDTMTGNLNFTPTNGNYGLGLYSSATDPANGQTGAIYFNTFDNILKIYTGGGWETLAQTGALTPTQANTFYLRLDGTNNPMTGNLSMGSSVFRFGNRNTDPISANYGDSYFNTSTNLLRVYTSAGWINIGSGVTAITVGNGLTPTGTITSTGNISVDQSYNFTWTGNNTFTQPIVFALSQTFNVNNLTISGKTKGDLIYYNGSSFTRLPIDSNTNKVLTIASDGLGGYYPTWGITSYEYIGTPTGGSYTDGLLDLTPTTTTADAVNEINQVLELLAPAKADLLTGNNLGNITSGYTVRLSNYPSGTIANAWYADGATAGSTVSGYITNGTYPVLNTTNLSAGGFRSGNANTPSTYGQLYHKIYNYLNPSGSVLDSIDITLHHTTPYTSGTLSLTSIGVYNSLWEISDATITYTQTSEGYEGHTLSHTEAGESNKVKYYFDAYSASNPNPVFSVSPSASENTGNVYYKYLSGITYYAYNSQFKVSFAADSGIFNRAYNANNVATISQIGMNTQGYNPGSVPMYNDAFDCTGTNYVIATLNVANQATMNKYLNVTLYKANGNSTTQTANISYAICTYGTVSNTTSDLFFDEAQRINLNTNTSWDSTATLVNGNAQVRNGTLQYADSGDYAGFTGDQEYQRFIYKTSASTGSITFSNLQYTNISSYGNGDINILLKLDNDNIYFDLGVAAGTPTNGLGQVRDGSTRAKAFGGRNTGSYGTTVNYSLGTYTTGPLSSGNLGRFRLIVIFKTNVRSITSISSS